MKLILHLCIVALFCTAHGSSTQPDPSMLSPQRAAFERFKSLSGQWQGTSTRGWSERTTFRIIAAASCVMNTSFDAHPNETMVTMYHLDGEHLMLTHYCVAGNQPRLRATEISEDGKTITFTFLDSTNLPSRDRGHMDKVVYRFESDDRFTSQWTWYQNGQERWMEQIEYSRIRDVQNSQTVPQTRARE